MSYGLACLTCRKYVVEKPNPYSCRCEKPVPSWDLKTPAPRGSLDEWLVTLLPSEGGDDGE